MRRDATDEISTPASGGAMIKGGRIGLLRAIASWLLRSSLLAEAQQARAALAPSAHSRRSYYDTILTTLWLVA